MGVGVVMACCCFDARFESLSLPSWSSTLMPGDFRLGAETSCLAMSSVSVLVLVLLLLVLPLPFSLLLLALMAGGGDGRVCMAPVWQTASNSPVPVLRLAVCAAGEQRKTARTSICHLLYIYIIIFFKLFHFWDILLHCCTPTQHFLAGIVALSLNFPLGNLRPSPY